MYTVEIDRKDGAKFIKMMNLNTNSFAKIDLNQGGSIQELMLGRKPIIKDLNPLKYSSTYASAVLFPFANRVKDGKYEFNKSQYQLEINEKPFNNALHGLVYNKSFEVLEREFSENQAYVKLGYAENNPPKGFPFAYGIVLEYVLNDETLTLSVTIKNRDSKPFPFTLGWHPYFYSSNLSKSSLVFDADKTISFDERMITKGLEDFYTDGEFEVKGQNLDDCFVLKDSKVIFKTPDYSFELSASSKDNFLQIYTPDNANAIAIEPTTGVSDSFNNNIGLQILEAGESYNLEWKIKILKNT